MNIRVLSLHLLLVSSAPLLAATQGFRRFHEGNSLTDPLTARNIGLHSMATNAGFSKDSVAQVVIAGTPIDWAWENRRSSFVGVLTNGGFDYVILQPFRLTQLGWFEREEVAAAQVFRLALQYSPNATLVLYQTWTTVTTNANPDAKFVSDMRYVTNYFEFFMDAIRQEFPGRAVFAVPSGLALMKLAEDIGSGAGPEGIPCITNIFDPIAPGGGSSIHPRVDGYWLSCLVHFNSYYSEHYITHPERFLNMPTNIPFTVYWQGSNAATWTYWPSVTSNQSAYFQDLAWHVVTNYPRTFLSNVPRVKGDWTPPSAPENIVFSGQTTSSVTVSWSASTDNVAVLRYTVMVNRDYAHTLSGLSTVVMLTNVVNPQAAEVTVRAWDTSYNFADATRALPEPAAAIAGAFAVACARRARAAGAPRRRA